MNNLKGDKLVWYAIKKIDGLHEKLDKKLDRSTFWKVMGGFIIMIGIIIGVIG